MRLFHGALFAFIIVLVNPAQAADESFKCTHKSGDLGFRTSTVLIERKGKTISVFSVVTGASGRKLRDDLWTYQVYAENKQFGLQAVRTHPPGGNSSRLAVELGGLLFIAWGQNKISAYVVGALTFPESPIFEDQLKLASGVLACERL
jgi:hypothetical protein